MWGPRAALCHREGAEPDEADDAIPWNLAGLPHSRELRGRLAMSCARLAVAPLIRAARRRKCAARAPRELLFVRCTPHAVDGSV
jgi:hypothetical protein